MSRRLPIPAAVLATPGERTMLFVPGRIDGIAVFNVDGHLHAIDDGCPHAGASLFGGAVDDGAVRCTAHGLRFDLASGKMRGGTMCVRTHAIAREGDSAYVIVED